MNAVGGVAIPWLLAMAAAGPEPRTEDDPDCCDGCSYKKAECELDIGGVCVNVCSRCAERLR